MTSPEATLPETIPDSQPTVAEQLDKQIEALRSQGLVHQVHPSYQHLLIRHAVDDLVSQKDALTSTLLSLPASQQALTEAQQSIPSNSQEQVTKYEKHLCKQKNETLVSAYRLGVGITLFESKDLNPNAVDGGRITGVRFENFDRGL